MSDRFLAPSGAMAIVIAVILSNAVSSAGQARSAAPTVKKAAATATWTPPRTPDGRPDLQGVWLIRTATPLERPKALEGRQFLTAEEVVELRKRADRIFNTGNSDFAGGDTVFLTALANVEQYKNPNTTHGAEHMVEREFDNRTSLIVDPPDGRIPPLTPAAQQRQAAARAAQGPPAGPEDLATPLRCLSWSVPRLGGRYGAGDLAYYQILQTPGYSSASTGPQGTRRRTRAGYAVSPLLPILPAAFSQLSLFRGKAHDGQLDTMPVVVRNLPDVVVALFPNLPAVCGSLLHIEATHVGAVSEVA